MATGVPCRLTPDLPRGGGRNDLPRWTHQLRLGADADLRDGCTRTAGQDQVTYADGDEVRITTATGTTRFTVVWVEDLPGPSDPALKRAYLLRHSGPWT